MKAYRPFKLAALLLLLVLREGVHAFDHTHARLAKVLSAQVTNGTVDYAALKSSPAELRSYLDEVAAVKEDEFKRWAQPQQVAFLLNLYNAATLQLVADNYPVTSIKKIGGIFGSPWKQEVVRLWSRTITLADLEHGLLRARYTEPRIHFALVCAAKSCPPLRAEPYLPDKLDAQLADQAKRFFAQPEKNRLEVATETLWLSPIFKWFGDDFTKDGRTVPEFAASFFGEADAKSLRVGNFKVKFTDYDWSLNTK